MAKVVVMKNIPANEVADMKQTMEDLGATNIKETKNADGTSTLEGTLAD